ncbi:MAG: flgF, partial [Rhodospirillales bacterium]|nr:flgF [Rhodospirillales bacterium]
MSSLAISSWQGLLANQQSQLARNAKSPSVTQALDYFNQKAPQITSVDQLFRDQKLLNIVLTSYGLESEMQYPARLRTLLTQDPSNQSSLVNQLVDPRFTKLVADLSFANGPPAALKDPTFQAKFAQTYATTVFEKNLGTQDPALREAAYFMRNIGNVTDVYQILSDTVLRDVTTHALQLPDGFGMLDITQQASILTQRLNLSTLQSSLAANSTLYQNATDDQGQITNAANLAKAA